MTLHALTSPASPSLAGTVALVGAGPGDPELLTIRAWRLLGCADVVCFDHLVSKEILAMCSPRARMIDVGKIPGGRSMKQRAIEQILCREALAGAFVVRLKGGDPFVFGRGGEEAIALAEEGIACQIVPGISSCIAAPQAAGIPVTHRNVSTHFTVVTGQAARAGQQQLERAWAQAARLGGTLVFLMGVRRLRAIQASLLGAGMDPETPCALVQSGTRATQRTACDTLAGIAECAAREGIASPAVLIVGEVVRLRDQIAPVLDRLRPHLAIEDAAPSDHDTTHHPAHSQAS